MSEIDRNMQEAMRITSEVSMGAMIEQLRKENSELKKKLEENQTLEYLYSELGESNKELEQQLSEKETLIENLKADIECMARSPKVEVNHFMKRLEDTKTVLDAWHRVFGDRKSVV